MKKAAKNKKSSRAKKTFKPKNEGTFCTECGKELDDFAFTDNVKDKKGILTNHLNCRKTGKFSGEFCSKIFISGEDLLNEIWDKE